MARDPRQPGFTLIEVIAVLVIVALLSGLAATVVLRTRQKVSRESVVERVVAYERAARAFAKRHGEPLRLVFTEETLEQAFADEETQTPPMPTLRVPKGYELQLLRPDGMEEDEAIEVSAEGRSRTYALRLRSESEADRWVVFAGLTGEPRVIEDEAEVDSILAVLSAPRLPELDAFEAAGADTD